MILTSGYIKGGVGKTTHAVNIAIARALEGKDVLLVDGDEQQTAATFTDLRSSLRGDAGPGYSAISLKGEAIRTQILRMTEKYDDIVIDVGGRDTGSLRAALTVSDALLVPVQPSTFDVWAMDAMAVLVRENRVINPKLRPYVFLNCADAQGKDNAEAAADLKEREDFEYLDAPIGRRKAFRNAAAQGLSVLEMVGLDRKAVEEFRELLSKLYQ